MRRTPGSAGSKRSSCSRSVSRRPRAGAVWVTHPRPPQVRDPNHDVVMVTGYDEAVAIYGDTTNFSSCNSVTGPFPGFPVPLDDPGVTDISELIEQYRDDLPFSDQLPTMDPPKHREH